MNATTAKPIQSGLIFLAAALLYIAVLVHMGGPVGSKLVAVMVAPIVCALGLLEINALFNGTWCETWTRRHQEVAQANSDPDTTLEVGTRATYWFIAFVEFFWAVTILLPTPETWVPRDTSVIDWILAHFVAAAVALAFYKALPGRFGWFVTVAMFSVVIASLGIAHEFPVFVANQGR